MSLKLGFHVRGQTVMPTKAIELTGDPRPPPAANAHSIGWKKAIKYDTRADDHCLGEPVQSDSLLQVLQRGEHSGRNVNTLAIATPRKSRTRTMKKNSGGGDGHDLYDVFLVYDAASTKNWVVGVLLMAVPMLTFDKAELCWLEALSFGEGFVATAMQEDAIVYQSNMIKGGLQAKIKKIE